MTNNLLQENPVPEKFLDKEGNVNVNDLAKSYVALEKKLGTPKQGIPNNAKGYKINMKNPLLTMDDKINERLFQLGLTNDQVQGIYDIAADILIPQIQSMAEQLSADKELQELEKEFGGVEQFNEIARQLSAWGEKNLDAKTFNTLATSKDGIMTLYHMMQEKQETPVTTGKSGLNTKDDETTLRRLMQDPKYWKEQDPELVQRVERGFRRLYG
ncbi:MAG: hypothetical protein IKQ99_00100 [Alphaproteobacteria bacterium]|nr:hypothetical protein [Alphaproteobacteria bacterium]